MSGDCPLRSDGRCANTGLSPLLCDCDGRQAEAIELAAERRYVELHRCRHRSAESIRTEPCACPSASELPIYRCELLDCDCSDLRCPQSPAKFCGSCKARG